MLAHLSSIPIWLHIIATLVALEAIVSCMVIKSDAVKTEPRSAPPEHIQKVINSAMWILTIFYLGIICFFWLGQNWARIFIIAGSTISLFNGLWSFKLKPKLAKTYVIFDSVFSACIILWLIQPNVSAYFTTPK